MDLLTNPWVIIAIVLAVIIGNIAALKYTANMKMGQTKKRTPSMPSEQNTQDSEKKDPPE
ncbi:DUF2897 family protein [Vibrio sp. 404]|uniref:DUF2897 family protein n=1 Tax=Vibrio marinisediminis TaxID=2758441 RepID=A0A7W2FSY7_9VIBR|nr:DUF2897 family protein [Vibrio marinisediminis]MBA5763680.1 DUF2897 family protein [Vibrio marinisediminis]